MDNIYTNKDGVQYINYGKAFADTEEAAKRAAIAQAKLVEIADGLTGLAHEFASGANGCFLTTRECENGRWICFLNRNIGKPAAPVTNKPKLAPKKGKNKVVKVA